VSLDADNIVVGDTQTKISLGKLSFSLDSEFLKISANTESGIKTFQIKFPA
jgi:hypothetical protein